VSLGLLCLVFAVVATCYHAFFLKTFTGWWMDDDPRNFAFVRTLSNPLTLFVDPALAKQFSGTATVNPMLGISFWLDSKVAYRNLFFAQVHNVIILAATLVMFFLVLRNLGLKPLTSSVILLLWLLSPATIVVSGWLAARHHLEGLLWSFGAVFAAQKLAHGDWRESTPRITMLLFLLGVAALYKETFAITVPLGTGLYLWHRHRRFAALSCASLLFIYCGYRCYMLGFTARYDAPLLSSVGFVEFLARLPYILAGNAGGYAVLAIGLVPIVLMKRRGELRARVVVYAIMVIGSSLAVIYPGMYALHRDWLAPGTWIRIVLLLQTGLLMGAGYLFSRLHAPSLGLIAAAVALPIAASGGIVAQKKWEVLRTRYEVEGKYYLNHPDRLLYSEVPSSWYLDGIRTLYAIPVRHHISRDDQTKVLAELLAEYREVWRYSAGEFVEDPELYELLSAKAERTNYR